MDTTMRQKLAFVAAHFLLDPGARIADIGCGSGLVTYQLALLNRRSRSSASTSIGNRSAWPARSTSCPIWSSAQTLFADKAC
jgi:hypothetical protein